MASNANRQNLLVRLGLVAALSITTAVFTVPSADAGASKSHEVRLASAGKQPTRIAGKTTTKSKARANAGHSPAVTQALTPSGCTGNAVSIAPGASPAGGYLTLSAFGISPMSGIGDETITTFTVPAFDFAGTTYTQVSVDSNGYLVAGSSSSNTFVNQSLSDPVAPNNVLAPFWTDLNPAAGGELRIGTLTDGSDTWVVVDYAGVREFSTAANTHSFEVWIGVNGDAHPAQDISYAYGTQVGNGDGGFLTVGAENDTGTSGAMAYYNGTGTLPSSGTQLVVTSSGIPTPSFTTTPATGPETLHVDFDASASTDDGTITAYDWDFGDSATGTGVTTSHDYSAGVYTVTLTVTDDSGGKCSATDQVEVTSGFSVDNVSVNENAGTATFTVTRNGGPAASVDVAAVPGSATTPADFSATSTTLNFASGETSQPFVVSINRDSLDEFNETYKVKLTNPVNGSLTDATGVGTIVDDDPRVNIFVNDANLTEGNSGTKPLSFRVTLNRASGKTVKVTLHTANGSATSPSDFQAKTVTLTFSPGQTLKTVSIAVVGDTRREPNETFFVLLNNAVNAHISDPNGSGGIINND